MLQMASVASALEAVKQGVTVYFANAHPSLT